FAALGKEYLRGARQMAGGSQRFIDKLPTNYMYCGMIRKALPRARIIHMSRDPLDACYAVFKTLFFGAYEFSYDLDELAQYYIAYHQTMRHWHEVMPDSILEVRYENLVRDAETEARRIYDWCGLEWDPAALEVPQGDKVFASARAAQVREPVHGRSVGSWRRHQAALSGLVDRLVAAGVVEACRACAGGRQPPDFQSAGIPLIGVAGSARVLSAGNPPYDSGTEGSRIGEAHASVVANAVGDAGSRAARAAGRGRQRRVSRRAGRDQHAAGHPATR